MTPTLVAFVIAACGLIVLGFLATGVLMRRASKRRKNIVSALALAAILAPALVTLLAGAL